MPGTRAYSAHNRLHVNAPTRWRFAQSYIIHHPFGVRTNDQQRHKQAMRGGGDVMAPSSLSETDRELPYDSS